MTNWHIQTIWLVTALTALILSIFITCKKDIKLTQTAESDYKDYKFDFKNENKGSNRIDPEDYDHLYRHRRHIGTLKRRIKVNYRPESNKTTEAGITRKYCVNIENTLRARHKSCFLRPDTGPCRADIIQWYYDARLSKCFRFFFGGCQGNGNKFETRKACIKYCYLNVTMTKEKLPYFCKLSFDFGTCFGHYYRWYWDRYSKTCKRRLYSGCGGNQNNFQSYKECFATCVTIPKDTLLYSDDKGTTCFPLS